MKTISFDVWFSSGVNVNVPAGTDPETPEGIKVIKAAAIAKMLAAVEEGSFDIECERYGEGDE